VNTIASTLLSASVHGPALGLHQHFHGGALAGAGIADVHALALEVVEGRDAGIGRGQDVERLGVHGEHRAQALVGTLALEFRAHAVQGVVLDVALHDPEVELALAHGVDVVHRAASALDRAPDAMRLPIEVDQTADGAAGRVVHAGDAAGADGDELLFLGGSEIAHEQGGAGQQAERNAVRPGSGTGSKVHRTSPG
jgi:hypothetical protein